MDRGFMAQYFDTVYEDFVEVIASNDEDYLNSIQVLRTAQQTLLKLCDSISNPIWQQHENVLAASYKSQLILMKLAYLKGAEDRERMLR